MNMLDIMGDSFEMGTNRRHRYARPAHTVSVPSFQIAQSEVTVSQYRICVESGDCSEPNRRKRGCNWSVNAGDKEEHPVNCLTWDQAHDFALWCSPDNPSQNRPLSALPAEAQWEFISQNAPSGGEEGTQYPTVEEPNCESAHVSLRRECRNRVTAPVCSKGINGNDAGDFFTQTNQDLCDVIGNVYEWMEDNYGRYNSTPTDGSAYVVTRGRHRTYSVIRGGSYLSRDRRFLTSYDRKPMRKRIAKADLGFRVACPVDNHQGCFDPDDGAYLDGIDGCTSRVGPYPLECYCKYVETTPSGDLPEECE